jgi:hypothetical protein
MNLSEPLVYEIPITKKKKKTYWLECNIIKVKYSAEGSRLLMRVMTIEGYRMALWYPCTVNEFPNLVGELKHSPHWSFKCANDGEIFRMKPISRLVWNCNLL